MPQFYYKNGKLYVSDDDKIGLSLFRHYKGNITFNGTKYLKYGPNVSIDNSFTPVTEQQINDAKKVIEGSGKIGDKIKYLHSKVNLMSNPKKKNITVTGSSTSSGSEPTSVTSSSTSSSSNKKRTQYQLPKGVESPDEIMKIQQMLLDANKAAKTNKYNLGTYGVNGDGVDGIWGAMTDAAYKLYLKDLFNYYANNAETEPVISNTKTEPVNENSSLLIKGVEISPVTPSFNQTINPSLILDRGDVRNIFRQYGMNPYLFTGSQRKSFRKWLGGDKTQNIDFIDKNSNLYQDWVAPYMTFQSSTVDRFRKGGIVRKFQEGNKFNFIKAEDITQKFKKIRKGQKGFLTSTLNKVKSGIDSELKKKNLSGIALLLHNLYEIGAFGNIDYDKAVDGTMGPRTKQALKKAKAMGYNFDVPKQDNTNNLSKLRENYFTKELKRVKEELNSEIERRDNGHAIYLNYPNFVGESKNAIKIGDLDIGEMIGNPLFPVGHAATILIDNNGNANYYEYGRYSPLNGHLMGKELRPDKKGGNWRLFRLPNLRKGENDSLYVSRIQNLLPDTNYGAYLAISIPSVDVKSATLYILQLADDPNRDEYGIFNTCATGACNAILPFRMRKIRNNIAWGSYRRGYSNAALNWSKIPYTTDSYAADMRRAADKIYVMNE